MECGFMKILLGWITSFATVVLCQTGSYAHKIRIAIDTPHCDGQERT